VPAYLVAYLVSVLFPSKTSCTDRQRGRWTNK